jgi:hypothetical protein
VWPPCPRALLIPHPPGPKVPSGSHRAHAEGALCVAVYAARPRQTLRRHRHDRVPTDAHGTEGGLRGDSVWDSDRWQWCGFTIHIVECLQLRILLTLLHSGLWLLLELVWPSAKDAQTGRNVWVAAVTFGLYIVTATLHAQQTRIQELQSEVATLQRGNKATRRL